jgi:cytochrome c oxidase subunit I+III
VVLAAVGTGFLSFGLWVHHMYTTGLPGLISLAIFSAASAAVAIPTGVQLFCFLATLRAGRPARSVPMLYMIGGLGSFVIGGLTGVMVAMAPFDLQAHDSFFIVAHLHTVLIGGAVFPLLAGLYYFYPLVRGRLLSERIGRVAFWLVFAGFNLTFMPMHVLGLLGMPRRVFTYPSGLGWESLNQVATAGAFVLALGLVLIAWDMLWPWRPVQRAVRNVWDAGTLEWLQKDPDLPWGVRTVPIVSTRYPLWQQPGFVDDYDHGRFYLPDAVEGRREMLVTSTVDAVPIQCMRIPGPTFITLVAAVFVGGFFIAATFQWYATAVVSSLLALVTILVWLWTGTGEIPEKDEKDVGLGLTLPLYTSGRESPGWWAMFITMLGDFAAFVSLIFGYVFYWTLNDRFLAASAAGPGVLWPATGAILIVGAWLLTGIARPVLASTSAALFSLTLLLAGILGLLGAGALMTALWSMPLAPDGSAYAATVWLLLVWVILHVALGLVMLGYCAARRLAGRMTARYDMDLRNTLLYWHFTGVMTLITIGVVAGFPLLR